LRHFNNLTFNHNNFNEHDRYIKIYENNNLKYELILSSGIFNILNINKDLSFILRVL